ncbi:MAG: hypothetical protein AAB525_04220, partial [Patescibacteria group bacterium]
RAETRSGAIQSFSVQKRFALRLTIPTKLDILEIQKRFEASLYEKIAGGFPLSPLGFGRAGSRRAKFFVLIQIKGDYD